jgi:UDP:flavonoid glycosyltransferase YjiC (YdhE family)
VSSRLRAECGPAGCGTLLIEFWWRLIRLSTRVAERRLPANVRYTGVVQAPIQAGTPKGKPLVLVSLSTIFFEGQEATLQAILDGLEDC